MLPSQMRMKQNRGMGWSYKTLEQLYEKVICLAFS
jgi:hypothetical protein